MQIESLQLHPYSAPRRYATQIAQEGGGARQRVAESPFILIEARMRSGQIGWGEISDLPPHEVPPLPQLQAELSDLLCGHNPFDMQALHAALRERYPFADDSEFPRLIAAGADMLCYDLQGQICGQPVFRLLGGRHRRHVRISWVAFIREDLDVLRDEIAAQRAAGFNAFKLKVGVDVELDEQRLAVLRETAGPEASLKIDPNGGWSLDEALRYIPRLARFGLEGVETPVGFRDPGELAVLRKQVDVPLIEHVMTPEDALAYIRAESLDWFNIATTGCGGIWPARQIAGLAETAGVGLLLGSTVELGPGTLAQLHLAASIRDLTLPSDLVGPALYENDILSAPLQYVQSQLTVPDASGLGISIDREALAAGRWEPPANA